LNLRPASAKTESAFAANRGGDAAWDCCEDFVVAGGVRICTSKFLNSPRIPCPALLSLYRDKAIN